MDGLVKYKENRKNDSTNGVSRRKWTEKILGCGWDWDPLISNPVQLEVKLVFPSGCSQFNDHWLCLVSVHWSGTNLSCQLCQL